MKQVSVVGHLPLCASLIAGGLLILAPEAHAAHWKMSYRPEGACVSANYGPTDGKWSFGTGYNSTTQRVAPNYGQSPIDFRSQSSDASYATSGSPSVFPATSASTQGSINIHLKWVQDPRGTSTVPTPKMVVLRISGYAIAVASSETAQSTTTAILGRS